MECKNIPSVTKVLVCQESKSELKTREKEQKQKIDHSN